MTSPFSIEHKWRLYWKRIPSNAKPLGYISCESPKEQKALLALAKAGVIGGRQLFHLFALDKKRLKKMVREQKIIRHEIRLNTKIIPVYTLGQTGAIITEVSGYEPNYWVTYKTEDVLKRILFFELYRFFPDKPIIPTPEPFTIAIQFNNQPMYVYVVRGGVQDMLMYLKWQSHTFQGRMIVIAESIQHVQPLLMPARDIKLRITTDEDLLTAEDIQNMFYYVDNDGNIVKEDRKTSVSK